MDRRTFTKLGAAAMAGTESAGAAQSFAWRPSGEAVRELGLAQRPGRRAPKVPIIGPSFEIFPPNSIRN
jgi:hypothetical protein